MTERSPNAKDNGKIQVSLEEAIESNIQVQRAVKEQLQRLATRRAENRRSCSKLLSHISAAWEHLDALETPEPPADPSTDKIKAMIKQQQQKDDSSLLKKKKAPSVKKVLSKWKYDPHRKTTRRFFVDPDGTVPEPNPDMVKRRQLEHGRFFYHSCPPWSKKELKTLASLVQEQQTQKKKSTSEDTIDFAEVAVQLDKRVKGTERNKPVTARQRTAEECRLQYLGSKNAAPLSSQEYLELLNQVHSAEREHGTISWQQGHVQLDNKTTWQAFQAHHSKLPANSKSTPWTPQEDEVLLKYLAAMGPQLVLDNAAAAHIASTILPDKTPKVILARANQSLLNPKFSKAGWTNDEERKLVGLMKIYRSDDNPNDNDDDDDKSSLTKAAVHFDRSSKSVSEKWARGLNPSYTQQPWTKREDDLIKSIGAEQDNNGGSSSTSQQQPSENSLATIAQQLQRPLHLVQYRWMELASPEKLLQHYNTKVKQRVARRGGDLLCADDIVLVPRTTSRTIDTSSSGAGKTSLQDDDLQSQSATI